MRKYYKYKEVAEGYREIEYLSSPNTPYIDTGFIPNSNTKIDCSMAWYTVATNNFAFGSGISYNNSNIELYSYGGSFETHYAGNAVIGSYASGYFFRYIQDKGLITVYNENGTLNSTANFGTKTFNCPYNLYIFALNRGSILNCSYKQSCKYFKIYDNDQLVRDFVPCQRIEDGELGLYDKVNNQFYTNATSVGSFSGGDFISIETDETDYDYYHDIPDGFSAFKNTEKEYYKYSIFPNCKVIGAPKCTNGIIRNLSSTAYMYTTAPFSTASSWEINIKCTTPAAFPSVSNIFCCGTSDCGVLGYIRNSNLLRLYIGQSSSWNIASDVGVMTLSTNTTYWFRWQYTGTQYLVYSSTNGIDYTLRTTINNSNKINANANRVHFGFRPPYTNEFWTGTIDLNSSSILINGELYWENKRLEKCLESDNYVTSKDVEKYYCLEDKQTHYVRYKRITPGYLQLNQETTDPNTIPCLRTKDNVTGTYNITSGLFTPDNISSTSYTLVPEESTLLDYDYINVTRDYYALQSNNID